MKSEQNTIYGQSARDIDAEISAILNKELPEASSNPWFTPRVMNRLPEQSRWSRISLWQWICYLLGFVGVIAAGVISSQWLVRSDVSVASLATVAFMSLILIICAAVMMVPSIVHIIREP